MFFNLVRSTRLQAEITEYFQVIRCSIRLHDTHIRTLQVSPAVLRIRIRIRKDPYHFGKRIRIRIKAKHRIRIQIHTEVKTQELWRFKMELWRAVGADNGAVVVL